MNSDIKALRTRQISTTSRWVLAVLAVQLVAVAGYAAPTTKYKTNLTATGTVVIPGMSAPVPRLLPASKVKFSSDGVLTVTLKGVRDAAGNLVTTTSDPVDRFVLSGDEYMVTVRATPLDALQSEFEIAVPVELKNGGGKAVLDLQYLSDQGLNYLSDVLGVTASGVIVTKSVFVWAPSSSAIMSGACASAVTRPNTAPSWVSGFSANYWLPTGSPEVNPCTSGASADIVGLAGVGVSPGSGTHGGGCQIEMHGRGAALWLLLMPPFVLFMKRRAARRI